MADKIVLKIFASATNPGEVGRRKAIVAQAAKSFGALRVDTKEDFSSLTLLVAFDDREKATAFQEDCNKRLRRCRHGLVGTGTVQTRYRHTEQPQIHSELAAMVNQVVHDHSPQHGHAGHGEDFLAAR